jgi:hypothetical protein
MTCPECGSERLVEIYSYGPTGCDHPDGGKEYRGEYALQCLNCGAIEPDYIPSRSERS